MPMSLNLLIVRTPFQAWLCLKLIDQLKIENYDLIYISHNDSEEDRFYFNRLSSFSSSSDYVYVRPARFDVVTHFLLRVRIWRWFHRRSYRNIYVASIDSLIINALVCRIFSATLNTFDDGVANLVKDDSLYIGLSKGRVVLYRVIFGAQSVSKIRKRIRWHYSIYAGYENIVPSERVKHFEAWIRKPDTGLDCPEKRNLKRYFIGAPFKEVMSSEEIKKMIEFMAEVNLDGYIKHPREDVPLPINCVIIEKRGRLAEEIIFEQSNECVVELYGFFSSTMINLKDYAEKRVVFLSGKHKLTGIGELARESGCQEIYLS